MQISIKGKNTLYINLSGNKELENHPSTIFPFDKKYVYIVKVDQRTNEKKYQIIKEAFDIVKRGMDPDQWARYISVYQSFSGAIDVMVDSMVDLLGNYSYKQFHTLPSEDLYDMVMNYFKTIIKNKHLYFNDIHVVRYINKHKNKFIAYYNNIASTIKQKKIMLHEQRKFILNYLKSPLLIHNEELITFILNELYNKHNITGPFIWTWEGKQKKYYDEIIEEEKTKKSFSQELQLNMDHVRDLFCHAVFYRTIIPLSIKLISKKILLSKMDFGADKKTPYNVIESHDLKVVEKHGVFIDKHTESFNPNAALVSKQLFDICQLCIMHIKVLCKKSPSNERLKMHHSLDIIRKFKQYIDTKHNATNRRNPVILKMYENIGETLEKLKLQMHNNLVADIMYFMYYEKNVIGFITSIISNGYNNMISTHFKTMYNIVNLQENMNTNSSEDNGAARTEIDQSIENMLLKYDEMIIVTFEKIKNRLLDHITKTFPNIDNVANKVVDVMEANNLKISNMTMDIFDTFMIGLGSKNQNYNRNISNLEMMKIILYLDMIFSRYKIQLQRNPDDEFYSKVLLFDNGANNIRSSNLDSKINFVMKNVEINNSVINGVNLIVLEKTIKENITRIYKYIDIEKYDVKPFPKIFVDNIEKYSYDTYLMILFITNHVNNIYK